MKRSSSEVHPSAAAPRNAFGQATRYARKFETARRHGHTKFGAHSGKKNPADSPYVKRSLRHSDAADCKVKVYAQSRRSVTHHHAGDVRRTRDPRILALYE